MVLQTKSPPANLQGHRPPTHTESMTQWMGTSLDHDRGAAVKNPGEFTMSQTTNTHTHTHTGDDPMDGNKLKSGPGGCSQNSRLTYKVADHQHTQRA